MSHFIVHFLNHNLAFKNIWHDNQAGVGGNKYNAHNPPFEGRHIPLGLDRQGAVSIADD